MTTLPSARRLAYTCARVRTSGAIAHLVLHGDSLTEKALMGSRPLG